MVMSTLRQWAVTSDGNSSLGALNPLRLRGSPVHAGHSGRRGMSPGEFLGEFLEATKAQMSSGHVRISHLRERRGRKGEKAQHVRRQMPNHAEKLQAPWL